jgi:hypothetical protein
MAIETNQVDGSATAVVPTTGAQSSAPATSGPNVGPPSSGLAPASTALPAQVPDWRVGLPDELKLDPTLQRIPDVPTLARSLLEKDKYIRTTRPETGPLSEQATPDQRQQYLQERLQRVYQDAGIPGPPMTPDGYQLERPVVEGYTPEQWQQETRGFREVAHRIGLTPPQVQELVQWRFQRRQEDQETLEKIQGDEWDKFEAEFPGTFEDERRWMKWAMDTHLDPDGRLRQDMQRLGLTFSVPWNRLLLQAARAYREDPGVRVPREFRPPSAARVKQEIDALLADRQGPLHNPLHPDHRATQQRWQQLFAQLEQLEPSSRRWPGQPPG